MPAGDDARMRVGKSIQNIGGFVDSLGRTADQANKLRERFSAKSHKRLLSLGHMPRLSFEI
jgi:hypothetical protein